MPVRVPNGLHMSPEQSAESALYERSYYEVIQTREKSPFFEFQLLGPPHHRRLHHMFRLTTQFSVLKRYLLE
jgi:hypothetical protein